MDVERDVAERGADDAHWPDADDGGEQFARGVEREVGVGFVAAR